MRYCGPVRVHFSATEALGGGHLRSVWPAEALGATYAVGEHIPRDAELVIVHRPLSITRANLVRMLKAQGRTVLVDEDDALDLAWQTGNEIAAQYWDDERRAEHDESIRLADGLIVTSDALAEMYGHLNPNVHIARNRMPGWVGRVRWHGFNERRPIVSWHGIVKTHRADLEWLAPHAAAATKGAEVQLVGDPDALRVLQVKGTGIEFQWELRGLYKLLGRADIGIVPLLPCRFNEAKSWLKALEYMTLGIPVVATDLPEQRLLIEHGVSGFLADTPEAFAGYVQELVNSVALRQSMARAARERTAEMYLGDNLGEWEAAVDSAHGLLHTG